MTFTAKVPGIYLVECSAVAVDGRRMTASVAVDGIQHSAFVGWPEVSGSAILSLGIGQTVDLWVEPAGEIGGRVGIIEATDGLTSQDA